ncbi:MAG: molecular chaperone DnaJ [Candidatus Pacebacteria bacterium]|nr:molecular chaperone DnaJ [Candidatus Paceibacterota bacterium]MDD5721761.1 molecular chaperone DnaJ [Candidatus Paceibacterota bacterium]
MKDYYEILGIGRNATPEEIKKAFYKLAHKHHPDKGGDAEKFKEINEAYQVLSNKEKRAQYDQFGRVFEGPGADFREGFAGGFDWSGFNWQGGDFQSPFGFSAGGIDLNDILADLFRGAAGMDSRRTKSQKTSANKKGNNIEVSLEINLEEAAFGIKKDVSFRTYLSCEHCQGKGYEPGSKLKECANCKSTGTIRQSRRTFLGEITQIIECPKCKGKGKIPEKPCKKCGGDGRYYGNKQIKVDIPAGIRDGETIRIRHEGEAGFLGGLSGDLYIRIIIKPHERFERQGDDLYTSLGISFTEATLGSKKEIQLLDKKDVLLKIPAGTESGEIFRLRNKGIKHFNAPGQGDLYVKVRIKTPKKVSAKVKKLLEDLEEELK